VYYSEPHTGSDCHFPSSVFGFFGSGVHRYREYCFKWLFLQNNPFNRDLPLQFNGLLLVTFLAHSLPGFFRERLPDALLLPTIAITSESWEFYEGLSVFCVIGNISGLQGSACIDLSKNGFRIFPAR
jgi:hypothetical protein